MTCFLSVYTLILRLVADNVSRVVAGHAGKLVFGIVGDTVVALLSGRPHYYEGHSIEKVTYPVRISQRLGIETVIVTNAAGGLSPEYAVGDIVVLNDHIFLAGLAGVHPLRGPNLDSFGDRFPPLSDAYDLALRRAAHTAWKKSQKSKSNRRLHEGVYAFVGGPSFETRAECRVLRSLGADLVGMSTVPEVVVARHAGLRVLALSLVTNIAVLEAGPRGDDPLLEGASSDDLKTIMQKGRANHEEVVQEGQQAALDMQVLVMQVVKDLSAPSW